MSSSQRRWHLIFAQEKFNFDICFKNLSVPINLEKFAVENSGSFNKTNLSCLQQIRRDK